MKKIIFGCLTYFLCVSFFTLNGMEKLRGASIFLPKKQSIGLINGKLIVLFPIENILKYNDQERLTFNQLSCIALLVNAKTGSLHQSKEINMPDIEDNTPLSYAVAKKNYAMVKYLIEKNADPNFYSDHKKIPLYIAKKKGHDSIVKLLLENGASGMNLPAPYNGEQGSTPLTIAAFNNNLDWVKEILEK